MTTKTKVANVRAAAKKPPTADARRSTAGTRGAKTLKSKILKSKTAKTKTGTAKKPATRTPATRTPARAAKASANKTGAKRPGARFPAAKNPATKDAVRAVKTAKPAAKPARPPKDGRSFEDRLAELKGRLQEIADLGAAAGVLYWDQATYMPAGGGATRGRQCALLSRLGHEKAVDPALGRLLDSLARDAEKLAPDSDDASLIRVARRDFEKEIRLPADYVERSSEHSSAAYLAWTKARPADDFAAVRPYLEKTVELSREYAGYFAPWKRITDPMIDDCDAGMTTESIEALFAALRRELVPIVEAICTQPAADDGCLRGVFAEAPQLDFNKAVAKRIGYDFERGRVDKTHHPFCTRLGAGDVRITTRFDEGDIGQALFSTIHEAGHAMYEQGVAAALAGTPLGHGASAGVHESQSRLWENVVGRGRGFWYHLYPALQEAFPATFRNLPADTFYRAINKVQRSLIRTDADEVTYNLHVMMRFDLELDLLEGRLEVKDLPEAWRTRIAADLGIAPQDDRDGCMQDVHWFTRRIGGRFQGYTIGNILSAQFYAAAVRAYPEIPDEITRGEFGTLHRWLADNIYRHGRKFDPDDLVNRATGEAMSIAPYVAYLRGKYGELYELPEAH